MVERFVEATMEAVAVTLREPDRAIDLFIRQVPEIGVTQGGRENTRLSQGIMQSTIRAPEAINGGLGVMDAARWTTMTDLVAEFAVGADARRPAADQTMTNRFAGRVRLSAAEWSGLEGSLAPFGRLLG